MSEDTACSKKKRFGHTTANISSGEMAQTENDKNTITKERWLNYFLVVLYLIDLYPFVRCLSILRVPAYYCVDS